MLVGLQTLTDLYKGPVIAESDCAFLVNELQPGARNLSACFPVINHIKKEAKKFQDVQIAHACRVTYKLAHGLASRARWPENMQSEAGVPDELIAVMLADAALAKE